MSGPGHGLIADLALMVAGIKANAKQFRVDRIELNSETMRAMERAIERSFGPLVKDGVPRPQEFAGLPLFEIPSANAPRIAVVLDMLYEPPGGPQVFK